MGSNGKHKGSVALFIMALTAVTVALTAAILMIVKLTKRDYCVDGCCCGGDEDFEDDSFDDTDEPDKPAAASQDADENGCQYTNDKDFV